MGSPLVWAGAAAKLLKSILQIPASTSGVLSIQPAATTTDHTLTLPSNNAVGVLNNDGAGVLSWTPISSAVALPVDVLTLMAGQRKLGNYVSVPTPGVVLEAFDGQDSVPVITLVKNASGGDTSVYLDVNRISIDTFDTTSPDGWTASAGSLANNSTAGQFVEGSQGLKWSLTNLNGNANLSKTFTAFSVFEKRLGIVAYLSTVGLLTKISIVLESTAGNTATYDYVAAGLTGASLNFLVFDCQAPTSTAGAFNPNSVTKIYLYAYTSGSQSVDITFDDLRLTDVWSLTGVANGTLLAVYDGTNQETMILTGETPLGKYSLAAGLSNAYTRAAGAVSVTTGSIVNQVHTFTSGATGARLSTIHAISRAILPATLTGKTLQLLGQFKGDRFQVASFPSSTTMTVNQDITARFKNGDKIVLFRLEKTPWHQFAAPDATLGNNFVILTLSGDSTVTGGVTTITTVEANTHALGNSNWYIVRLSLFLNYLVGAIGDNSSLSTLTPTLFLPIQTINKIFSDDFNRADGAPGNNWTAYTNVAGSTSDLNGNKLRHNYNSTTNTGSQGTYRSLESYDVSRFPLELRCTLVTDTITVSPNAWSQGSTCFCVGNNTTSSTPDGDANGGLVVRVHWANDAPAIAIYSNTSLLTSVGASFTAGTVYEIRIQYLKTGVNFKYWAQGTAEPSAWTLQATLSSPLTSLPGTRFNVLSYIGFGGTHNVTVNIDDVVLRQIDIGYLIGGNVASQTGQKIVLDAVLDRKDTTNDVSSVVMMGALLS